MQVPGEFGQAIAIARGTPAMPLVEPEDLFDATIADCTPRAKELGVAKGMTGREAVELMLAAAPNAPRVQEPAASLRVKQIDHVTFVCQNLDRSRAFYGGLLGMMEVARPNFSFPGLWFQAGATQIHLIGEHDLSGPAQTAIAADAAISRTRHVAFEVDDAQAAVRLLESRGVAIVSGPKSRPDGPTQLYILDPDGNLIEIFARLA
jgi:catechol 2,3-dioxygenase-like lactoylglutathione lyase family enzyme